jgi:lipoate-protein ligase B
MLDARQREIAERVRSGGVGAFLLSEIAPVITVGRRAAPSDLLLPRAALDQAGVEVLPTDRGGLATWHGPGQWVFYAVDSLERLTGDRRGVRKAVEWLLDVALRVGRAYDSSAEIRSGAEMGVWTRRGKFAALGIHVDQGVLLHGLSINGFRTPTSFMGLRPCGLDLPVDFLIDGKPELPKLFDQLGTKIIQEACANLGESA